MTTPQRLSAEQCTRIAAALQPFKPSVIYVFGSFGTPSEHPKSDLDLAFLPTENVDPLACFHIASTLSELLGRSVDLVDLTHASTVFSKEVLRTGSPIEVQNPRLQQQFEMLTLSDYARLNEEREPILAS